MAEQDLSLKAVLEAVLDAKGFEEFKTKVAEASANAERSGQRAEATGEHFNKLGRVLPQAAFHGLSREMLANAGVQEGLGPLTRISTVALESLAAAGKLTGTAFAGATLGLTLLIPLLAMMASKGEEAAEATTEIKDDTDSLVASLEELKKKTGTLTEAQQRYLDVLKQVQAEERRRAEETLQKQIEAEEKATKSALGLWSATKMLVSGMIDHQIKGKDFVSLEDRMFEASEKHRKEAELLKAKLDALREAHEHGASSAGEYAGKLNEAAEAAKKLREERTEQELRNFETLLDIQNRQEERQRQEAKRKFLEDQAIRAASEKKNRAEAMAIVAAYVKANEQADRQIMEADLALARTQDARQKARAKLFDKDLADQVADYRRAKLSEEKIAEIVEKEKARFATETVEIERQLSAQRANLYIQGAQQAVGILSTLFGQSKAIQYAETIVNTAAAAVSAISPPNPPLPYSAPFLALALATGAAQLAVISKASPSGNQAGFDDPINDMLARDYGRQWASDFTREVGKGFAGGLRDSAGGRGNVINSRTTINRGTNIGTANFLGLNSTPDQALLGLQRRLIRIDRVENRTRRRSAEA